MSLQLRAAITAGVLCLLGPLSFELKSFDLGGGEWIIPITLQSLVVIVMPAVFGSLPGVIGVALYLIAGALGLPVFAGYSSGWQSFTSASGGFLLGFLVTAWLAGWGYQKLEHRHFLWLFPMFVVCQLVLLLQGSIGLLIHHIELPQVASIMASLLPGLLVKALLATLLTLGLRAVIRDDRADQSR